MIYEIMFAFVDDLFPTYVWSQIKTSHIDCLMIYLKYFDPTFKSGKIRMYF